MMVMSRRSPSPGCPHARGRLVISRGLHTVRDSGQVRRMGDQGLIKRRGFWLLALLWLPAGVIATAALRFAPEAGPGMWLSMILMSTGSLVPVRAA